MIVGQALALTLMAGRPSERLQLQWSAPAGCPGETQVRKDVDGLAASQAIPDRSPIVAVATIKRNPDGTYTLTVSASGQTRTIEGEGCRQLSQAAALFLALLVDPSRATPESDAPGPSTPNPESQPLSAASVADEPRVTHAPAPATLASAATPKTQISATPHKETTETLILVEAGTRLDFGSWPKAEPALTVGAGFATSHWSGLSHLSVGQPLEFTSNSGELLRLFISSIDIMGSHRWTYGIWGLEPGIGSELGIVSATSKGWEPRSKRALSLSALGVLRTSLRLGGHWWCWGEVGAGFPAIRPRWVVDGEQLHRFGPFLRAQTGLQVAF